MCLWFFLVVKEWVEGKWNFGGEKLIESGWEDDVDDALKEGELEGEE